MNARFWVYWNGGWVKLTLRRGETVTLYECHSTDEGYAFRREDFSYYGTSVQRTVISGGSDCDGPIEHHAEYSCPVTKSMGQPEWQEHTRWQRDAYAEAAGY